MCFHMTLRPWYLIKYPQSGIQGYEGKVRVLPHDSRDKKQVLLHICIGCLRAWDPGLVSKLMPEYIM